MDLDPKLNKYCAKKRQDMSKKLEKIEKGVQDLIQWLKSNDKKFL